MSGNSRCQSEVVGVVLLTAVIVILASVVGVFLLTSFQSETDEQPRVTVQSEAVGTLLTLKHNGGDRFEASSIAVVLRGQNETRLRLTDGTFTGGSDDTLFEPGDIWEYNYSTQVSPSRDIRLFVFDDESGTLLHRDTLEP